MLDPAKIGMSVERLERIRPAVEQHLGEEKIAGVVTLVARQGEIAYFESFGLADCESDRQMTTDSIFRLYSMTKPITMVALLMLLERGLVRLNDPVSRFVPGFGSLKVVEDEKNPQSPLVELEQPVTIHHLLTHTSGLTYHFAEYGCVEQMYRDAQFYNDDPLAVLVDNLTTLPLAFQPGATWRYSVAHDVVARVVEIASGMSYSDYLLKYILGPLGMNDTGFWVPGDKLDRFAAEYGYVDIREHDMTGTKWQGGENPKRRLIRGPGDGLEAAPHQIYRGGSRLVSTAMDYFRFSQMLLNGGVLDGTRVLSRKTVEMMTSNHLRPNQYPSDWTMPGVGFGLGVRVMLDPAHSCTLGSIGEHGWGGAAGTYYWVDPVEQLIGIFMVQFQPGGIFQAGSDFRTAVYQAIDD